MLLAPGEPTILYRTIRMAVRRRPLSFHAMYIELLRHFVVLSPYSALSYIGARLLYIDGAISIHRASVRGRGLSS